MTNYNFNRNNDNVIFSQKSEKNLSELTSIMDTMANTRLDDQRCQLGGNNRKPDKKQERKNSDLLNIFQHSHGQVVDL